MTDRRPLHDAVDSSSESISPAAAELRSRRAWPWMLVLAAAACAACIPAIDTGPFISAEDSMLRLPLLSNVRNIPVIFSPDFMIFTQGQYRPLSYALLALVRTVVPADKALFWHVWLVLFHVLNALLVFALVRHFVRRPSIAFLASLLFAVHPMASLYVNHVNRFQFVLGGTLALGTMLCYIRAARSDSVPLTAVAAGLFAAGLLTSKMLLLLPALLLLYDACFLRPGMKKALLRIIPFIVCAGAVSSVWLVLRPHLMFYEYPSFPPGSGWFSLYTFAGRTGKHLGAVIAGTGFDAPLAETTHRYLTFWHPRVVLWSLGLVCATALAALAMVRRRWIGFGVLLAVLSAAPYASITFHRSYAFLSWDYLYLVLCGFALFAGAVFERGISMRSVNGRVFTMVCAIVLIGWYAASFAWVNLQSRGASSYWTRALTVNPRSDIATIELGRALLDEGDRKAALRQLFPPRRLTADWQRNLLMARHYASTGELTAAAVHYNRVAHAEVRDLCAANRIQWVGAEIVYAGGALDYAEQALAMILMANRYDTAAMRRLGEVLARKGCVRAGLMYLEEARRIDPGDAETLRALERVRARIARPEPETPERITPPRPGWLVYLMGGRTDAETAADIIRTAEGIPDDPVLQAKAGECLLALGEPERARQKLTLAARMMPRDPFVEAMKRRADEAVLPDAIPRAMASAGAQDATMWNDMGYLCFRQGEFEQACRCFRSALEADPDSPRAHIGLGHALANLKKHEEAVVHYRAASALAPADPEPYRGIASALTSLGRYAESIRTLEDALKSVPDDTDLKLRLAWLLSVAPQGDLRDGARALALAEAVGESLTEESWQMLDVLAAAYAEAGRFQEAAAAAAQAVDIARSRGLNETALTIEERLRLYEKQHPWRAQPPSEKGR